MRTGAEYLSAIAGSRGVYLDGHPVPDVVSHPAFRGPARVFARMFDLAVDPANDMLYTSPETGREANRAFMIPRTREDLVARRAAIQQWTDLSQGFIGRGPEHVAGFLAGFASAAEIFGAEPRDFAEHVRAFHRRVLDESLYVSYTILPPQFDRSSSAGDWDDEFVQAGVVDRTTEGIVVRGSMALGTAAPFSDYMLVSCIKPLRGGDEAYANTFVVPVGTPGLKLICRRPYALTAPSAYDYPLSTRFDESDCFATFDDVFVPWEQVFALGSPQILHEQFFRTAAHSLGNTQAQIRLATKLKFIIGVARKVTAVNGIDRLPPVQDKLGELASLASLVEGMTLAAEATSAPDEFGVERPNARFLYGMMARQSELYPQMIQCLRDLTGVGVLQVPSSIADLDSPEVGPDIDRYVRSPGVPARERIKLFKLAWELVGSEFAGRHQHYEMFYAGAPFIVRSYAFRNYGYEEPLERVERFLDSYSAQPDSLNEALAAQRARTNPEAVARIEAANAELAASGVVKGLHVGDRAPDFTLPDPLGGPVALSERLARGPVVLTFYRGEWCPYCNLTLAALQRALPDIRAAGASLIAISPQLPDDALTMREKHGLEFDVLSDADQHVIGDYGVQFRVPADVEDVHMTVFKKDVAQFNADGSWNLPVPATFVIDRDGVVRAAHVGVDYTQRMEPAQILDALSALR